MLHDLALLTPLLITLAAALFTLLVDPFLRHEGTTFGARFWGYFGAAFSLITLAATAVLWVTGPHEMATVAFSGHLSMSPYGLFFVALVSVCAALTHLTSPRFLEEQGMSFAEFYALLHFAAFGMMVMVAAESILTLFIGLEIMSLSIYVLAAFKRSSAASIEAGTKYFLMGAVSSALLLYGMAFVYGFSGGTSYVEIQRALIDLHGPEHLYLSLSLVFLLAAFLFKVSAVPFHMWAPDAYEGAPTSITGFMSSGVKVAAFGALLKLLVVPMSGEALASLPVGIGSLLAIFAVITMTVGNLLALPQRNVKRMLAYSAIAHAGYLLLGCVAMSPDPGLGAPYALPGGNIPFYLVGYALASLAAFAALVTVGADGEELTTESQLAGLGRRHPFAGAVLGLAMISLAGVPPTLGFFGKFVMLREVLSVEDGRYLPHVVIMVLNSVVAAYYYLRVTVYIYMRPEGATERRYVREPSLSWAMGLAAAGLLIIGLLPGKAIEASRKAAAGVRTGIAVAHLHNTIDARQATAKDPAEVVVGQAD